MNENALQYLLEIIQLSSTVASGVTTGDAAKYAALGASLVTIIQKAIAAHEAVVGQPIDTSLLRPFEPIP